MLQYPKLEDVFKQSGVPVYTFVKPEEYTKLLVSLRTPGRGLVIEGPSGIGKTTSVFKALEELSLINKASKLSARKQEDRELVEILPSIKNGGIVVIDDFHKLEERIKVLIADYMKVLADEEDQNNKIVIVGINKAGDTLVKFAPDLNNRIDTIRFEANPDIKVEELITKGEEALNIIIPMKQQIISDVKGSFHLAQLLCHELCVCCDFTERQQTLKSAEYEFVRVKRKVLDTLGRNFRDIALKFARGRRLRREGRAPYFHILRWISESADWSLQMDQALVDHPDHKVSVGQVVEQGHLETFLRENPEFAAVLHFDVATKILSVEDPKFVYYLRNLNLEEFAKTVGLIGIRFTTLYDFALSFAGTDREIAKYLAAKLREHETAVFYDHFEQHDIFAENVEDYLKPIYDSQAKFIIVLNSKAYPNRVWTRFESAAFKHRLGEGAIIPIFFTDSMPGVFDPTAKYGGYVFDPCKPMEPQVDEIVVLALKKLGTYRISEQESAAAKE